MHYPTLKEPTRYPRPITTLYSSLAYLSVTFVKLFSFSATLKYVGSGDK